MSQRGSGILLHISSLPSRYGIGDLGPGAYALVDFLAQTKQSYWQVLPLTPTETIDGSSPYSSPSAFAGNALFISPDLLLSHGLLKRSDLASMSQFSKYRVNYHKAMHFKRRIFAIAFENYLSRPVLLKNFDHFCKEHRDWLDDFALFTVLRIQFQGRPWNQWPHELKDRERAACERLRTRNKLKIQKIKFLQYLFYKQWLDLRGYCQRKHIMIIGDIPIYVNFDSADVWTHPDIFKLDKMLNPKFVAGVPPDYFSKTGQRWGNPVYDWRILKRKKYHWWIKRIRHNLKLYDYLRIDHFRGFAAYWQVPAREKTAVHGRWIKVPGLHFFRSLQKRFPRLPIIAEDIGYITPDVRRLIKRLGFPGMRVLQFAFGSRSYNAEYLPSHYPKKCVAYTGTHDNNTIRGWFFHEITPRQRDLVYRYAGRPLERGNIHWRLIEKVMDSKAKITIIPLQDILGLTKESRMNTPGTHRGNWSWRFQKKDLNSLIKRKLLMLTKTSKRI